MQDHIGLEKDVDLYPKSKGESWKGFKQGSDMNI